MFFFHTQKEIIIPLNLFPVSQNFDFDHDYLTAISKLFRQTGTQMLDDLFEIGEEQSVGNAQVHEFNKIIEEPIKTAVSYYNDLYGDDEPQKSLLITYVRVFTDHITPRYLLETRHYVRSVTDILKIKKHLLDLIQSNKIIVRELPLSEHPSTEQFELLSFNPSNCIQSKPSASEPFGNELPLIKQTAVQLTGDPDILKNLNISEITDAQKLVKLLLMV